MIFDNSSIESKIILLLRYDKPSHSVQAGIMILCEAVVRTKGSMYLGLGNPYVSSSLSGVKRNALPLDKLGWVCSEGGSYKICSNNQLIIRLVMT